VQQDGQASPQNLLGKSLLDALKPIIKADGHDDKLLNSFKIPAGYEMAPDRRDILTQAIASPNPA
jgi:hypothetical protein